MNVARRCSVGLRLLCVTMVGLLSGLLPCLALSAFMDPLDSPAVMVSRLSERPMVAVATAGRRLVAVGSRGVIIVSDTNGDSWSQSRSPVQSDLVAVHFSTEKEGWSAGHDGVVLHSDDGGATWIKQLDGRIARDTFTNYYRPGADAGNADHRRALDAIERNYASGPALPFLDVWFEDANRGFAVGSFGMLIATTDGGRHWEPWLDRIDNPELLNLNGIRGINGVVFIVAERGVVFRLDRAAGKFEKLDTGYRGSFFGLVASDKVILAYGLRGTVYRSEDRGETWASVAIPSEVTISGGVVTPGARQFVLVNAAGELLRGDETGKHFSVQKGRAGMRYTGIAHLASNRICISSLDGIVVESLQ